MADDAGFAAFVRANSGSLFKTAYLLTGNADRAEELLQDTLARLYPRWDRVQAADTPWPTFAAASRTRSSTRDAGDRRKMYRCTVCRTCPMRQTWPSELLIVGCCGSCSAACRTGSVQRWSCGTSTTSPMRRSQQRSVAAARRSAA